MGSVINTWTQKTTKELGPAGAYLAKFKRRTFHEPYFIVAIKFKKSTQSKSTEYVLYYMVRLRCSVWLAQPYLYSPAENFSFSTAHGKYAVRPWL